MTKIVILGAGEQGRTVAEKCRVLNYQVLGFLDDTKRVGEKINDDPVLGGFDLATTDEFDNDVSFHVALGDPAARVATNQRLKEHRRKLVTIIHPSAGIERPCEIGEGSFITFYSVVGINCRIGNYVIVHSFVMIGPDAHLQDGSWIAPHCVISRGVSIGRETFVGSAAIVLPDISIGANCIVGAGSLVTKDIPDNCTAYGSPCRVVSENA